MSVLALLWIAMIVYAVVMFALSPKATTVAEFFSAKKGGTREMSAGFLIGSVVISWLFAKSITNAANLGASYGIVGSFAYAAWYVTIPVVGLVIYELRRNFDVGSLSDFVILVGSLPLYAGTEILKATTISGTMVLGLAPVFLLWFVDRAGPFAFHLAFWPGVAIGIAHTAGATPPWMAIGTGDFAQLLGVNLVGTVLVFVGFGAGTLVDDMTAR